MGGSKETLWRYGWFFVLTHVRYLPTMAKRLGVKYKKRRRDQASAYAAGTTPSPHKVAVERSRKARMKNANHMK